MLRVLPSITLTTALEIVPLLMIKALSLLIVLFVNVIAALLYTANDLTSANTVFLMATSALTMNMSAMLLPLIVYPLPSIVLFKIITFKSPSISALYVKS